MVEAAAQIQEIKYLTDKLVRLHGTYDTETLSAISETLTSATCTFKVYDAVKSASALSVAVSSGVLLTVGDASLFELADTVEVRLDTTVLHDAGLITSIDLDASTITVTNAVPSIASIAAAVLVRLGSEVEMTEYGTPHVGKLNYGFRGLLEDTHPGLELWMLIDVVISLVGTPGGGLDRRDVIHARVVENIGS
jgi:hypothetical protein